METPFPQQLQEETLSVAPATSETSKSEKKGRKYTLSESSNYNDRLV